MKLFKILSTLVTALVLSGCSGGSESSDSTSATRIYDGIWKYQTQDNYIEIANGFLSFKRCSINDGYPERSRYSTDGNSVDINGDLFEFSISGDDLFITELETQAVLQFIQVPALPSACTGDAVEITFISPLEATAGIPTSFIVNFDYRLSSKNSAIIFLASNTISANSLERVSDYFNVTSPETSSGSISTIISPVFYNSPDVFSLVLLFYSIDQNSARVVGFQDQIISVSEL